jgi:hypothetical protein
MSAVSDNKFSKRKEMVLISAISVIASFCSVSYVISVNALDL